MVNSSPTSDGISRPVNNRGISKPWYFRHARASPARTRLATRGFNALDQFFDLWHNILHDNVDARRRRMQSVRQIELGVTGHAFEKKRIQDRAMGRGQFGIHAVELL